MLISPIVNPITFKDLTNGDLPNAENTLHRYYRHGNYNVIQYCQKFPNSGGIVLQLNSDSATPPEIKAYKNQLLVKTTVGVLANTVTGTEGVIYFFNFLLSDAIIFNEQVITFTATQGTDILTSEPVLFTDLTEQIGNGEIKVFEYSNFDAQNSDLSDFFVDWSSLTTDNHTLRFYIEGNCRILKPTDKIELLEGVQSVDVISGKFIKGVQFKSGIIPEYMIDRLISCSMLDFVSVNGISYVRDGAVEFENVGNSTSFAATISLTQKYSLGLNVDNLGFIMADLEWMKFFTNDGITTDFTFDIPDGYFLHSIFIRHAALSSGNVATATCGHGLAGTDIIDAEGGNIEAINTTYSFAVHDKPDFAAANTIYFGVTGDAVVLSIRIVCDRMESF